MLKIAMVAEVKRGGALMDWWEGKDAGFSAVPGKPGLASYR
jgi:streptomycin 6-kinase